MASVFIFAFVAFRTNIALPATLTLYFVLIALAGTYALWYGVAKMTRPDVNLLVQEFVVSNAFTIANVPAGKYVVRIDGEGEAPARKIELRCDKPSTKSSD